MLLACLSVMVLAQPALSADTYQHLDNSEFLTKVSAIAKDYFNATEFFLVRQDTAVKVSGKVQDAFTIDTKLLHKIVQPALWQKMKSADWTAYQDAKHRVEPIVCKVEFNDEKLYWACASRVSAVMTDSGTKAVIEDDADIKSFALDWLATHFDLPKRPEESILSYMKNHDGIWAGYVLRGIRAYDKTGHQDSSQTNWDNSFTFITDGQHVLVRFTVTDPQTWKEWEKEKPKRPFHSTKTKSRFEE